jgi:hypothetical protein
LHSATPAEYTAFLNRRFGPFAQSILAMYPASPEQALRSHKDVYRETGFAWAGYAWAHLETRGLQRRDLEPYLGSRARVAEILNRKRALSIDMIRRLHSGLGISAEALIRPYEVKGSAA